MSDIDGKNGSYYDLVVPATLNGGQVVVVVRTEDIIRHVLHNDFDGGNVFKGLVRLFRARAGNGKTGNTAKYEAEKIVYYADKLEKHVACENKVVWS